MEMFGITEAARRVIEEFVLAHGGRKLEIQCEVNGFRWVAPDGRVAWVGWA
jgi:hypothetical protein